MNGKKMEVVPRQQSQPPREGANSKSTKSIVANLPDDVKALRALRSERHIPVADIVEVVASIYPRFDRYLLSKVEHGDEYGIRLRADAERDLMTKFAIKSQGRAEAHRKPNRSKPKRITCRLMETTYEALQRLIEQNGVTMQGFLEALICKALTEGAKP